MSDERVLVALKTCGCWAGWATRSALVTTAELVQGAFNGEWRLEGVASSLAEQMPRQCAEHQPPAAVEVAAAGGSQLPGFDAVAARPAEGRYPG